MSSSCGMLFSLQQFTSFYPNVTTLRLGTCYRKSVCRLSVCDRTRL